MRIAWIPPEAGAERQKSAPERGRGTPPLKRRATAIAAEFTQPVVVVARVFRPGERMWGPARATRMGFRTRAGNSWERRNEESEFSGGGVHRDLADLLRIRPVRRPTHGESEGRYSPPEE